MTWKLAVATNVVITIAYALISLTVYRGLRQTRQVGTNRLGLATAAIFLSCAAGHGYHVLHMMLPALGIAAPEGHAMRAAYDWHLVLVDGCTALIGVWYWSLRSSFGAVLEGPSLFEDMAARQRQALELNDNILQGLSVAAYSLERGDHAGAEQAIQATLGRARGMVHHLLGDEARVKPGDLVRREPAPANDA